jgi:hypothetical protein
MAGDRDHRLRELLDLSERVRRAPTLSGFLRLIALVVARPLRDIPGMVLAGAIVLIVLWGPNGGLALVGELWDGWRPFEDPAGRPSVIPGIPWDQEWLAFAAGFVLLVLVPCALIKFVFHHDLRDYGLGLPPGNRMRLAAFSAMFLFLAAIVPFLFATGDEGMKATYPLYRGALDGSDFWIYEAGYLLFFIAIEFVFRGWLLLGLFPAFGYYALFVAQVAYTLWHLDKPTPELLGTLVWGPVAGAVVLLTRSIWPIVAVHFALNVVLDLLLK